MSDPVQLSSQVHVTQLFEENTNKRQVLTSQPNGQAPLCAARSDHQITEPAHHCRQSSAASNKSMDSKPKPSFMSPELAMKQFMSKMSSFEHHEVFSYPEGELASVHLRRKNIPIATTLTNYRISPQCTLSVQMPRRSQGSWEEPTTVATTMIRGHTSTFHTTTSPSATKY